MYPKVYWQLKHQGYLNALDIINPDLAFKEPLTCTLHNMAQAPQPTMTALCDIISVTPFRGGIPS